MKKNIEKVLLATIELVNLCVEMEEIYDIYFELDDAMLRVEDKIVYLEGINGEDTAEKLWSYRDDANCTIQEFFEEEYLDGAIFCEGTLYETLYYYEAGSLAHFNQEITKEVHKKIAKVLAKYGYQLDLTMPGIILLQTEEQIKKQLERDLGIKL